MENGSLEKLSQDTLRLARNMLLVNLRFLDMALSRLEPVQIDTSTILTDGRHILYRPVHVLRRYRTEAELPARDYLHIVLHCVFRHMYAASSMQREYWDLACDIAVENIITELHLPCVTSSRESRQAAYIRKIQSSVTHMTAEKIHAFLREAKFSEREMTEMRECFGADDHAIWYMPPERAQAYCGLQPESKDKQNNGDGQGSGDKQKNDNKQKSGGSGENGSGGSGSDDNSVGVSAGAAADWQEISERMQVDMETFGKHHGIDPGALTQNLAAVNREKYDYTAFLKKFAVMNEVMRINDDEFDYIFYTYGLQLYRKMPLIEPLEYKDAKRIREFVIAIDTSGSTSGELVRKFVQKTYNILRSTETFASKINLHIIQCDAAIQEDTKITSTEDFDRYLKTMKIRGLGGTDFRPVFSYVEKLREEKEFQNLKGLIYFTDGWGDFPAKKPDYDVAFTFIDDDYNNPEVPPWAIKLVLQRDEI